MGRMIGIDLGTTNSVVAVVDMGGTRVLQNRENEQMTRSVVGYYKENFLIGTPAVNRWPAASKDTVISIKRLMGRAITDPEVEKVKEWASYQIVEPSDGTKDSVRIKIKDKEYSPVDISAMILKKLKDDAEFVLGEEVTHAVITVPAYFSEKQKHATREAGLQAGLTVMKVIDEPTAAAIAFGIDSKEQKAKTILVYDLGGGTFDISVLMMTSGTFATLNVEGDMWLGGDNFDQIIVEYAVEQIKKEHNVDPLKNSRFMAMLKIAAQKAKETLGQSNSAEIFIPGVLMDNDGDLIDIEVEITRELFLMRSMPLVKRTIELCKKAIENAHMELEDIDHVLMAGNSTCMPMIQEVVEKYFGEDKVLRKVHPKNSVAMGAAMAAATLRGIICPKCNHNNENLETKKCEKCETPLQAISGKKRCLSCGFENNMDVENCSECGTPFIKDLSGGTAPFHYGIQTAGDKFSLYIEKGDTYETKEEDRKVKTFYTQYSSQRIISIPVFGGDNTECASKNEKQGEAFATLPPCQPEATGVRIKLWLNKDGIFDLSASLEDGTSLNPSILRGGKNQQAVERLRECMEKRVQKDNVITPKEKELLDKKQEKVLKDLEEERFEEANKDAEELLKDIDSAGEEDDALIQQADNTINYVFFILEKYGWLMRPTSTLSMRELIAELESAIKKKDRKKIEVKISEVNEELTKLPQLIKDLLNIRMLLRVKLRPVDPSVAQDLEEELNEVEVALKNDTYTGQRKLEDFFIKLIKVLKEVKIEDEYIDRGKAKCQKCGHINTIGVLQCENEKCKANLGLLKAERDSISSESMGDIFGR